MLILVHIFYCLPKPCTHRPVPTLGLPQFPRIGEAQGTKEHRRLKKALKTCGYPIWAFIKSKNIKSKRFMEKQHNNIKKKEEEKSRHNNIVILLVARVFEKLKRLFSQLKFLRHTPRG